MFKTTITTDSRIEPSNACSYSLPYVHLKSPVNKGRGGRSLNRDNPSPFNLVALACPLARVVTSFPSFLTLCPMPHRFVSEYDLELYPKRRGVDARVEGESYFFNKSAILKRGSGGSINSK